MVKQEKKLPTRIKFSDCILEVFEPTMKTYLEKKKNSLSLKDILTSITHSTATWNNQAC